MKRQFALSTALAAGVLCLGALSPANAITISSVNQDLVTVPGFSVGYQAPDFGVTGIVDHITPPPGSTDGINRSPWETTTDAHIEPQWSTLQYTSVRNGNAGYNISGTSLQLFWGSPDTYNSITFWTGLNGTGSSVTETGTDLAYAFLGHGHDLVTIFLDQQFNSFVLNSGQPAFEFANMVASCGDKGCAPATTPIPGALPLFATAIGGVGGLLGWRRKRKAQAVAA